jgi:hypothetical protein
MKTSENKAQKKLIEIVLYMAGILMYHVNIFGINNLHDLNKKIGELLAIIQDEENINEAPCAICGYPEYKHPAITHEFEPMV